MLQLQERDHQKSLFCLADMFWFLVGHLKATWRLSVQKQFLPEVIALHTWFSRQFKPRASNEIEWIFVLITVKTSKALQFSWGPSMYAAFCTEEENVIPHKWEENELSEAFCELKQMI